MNTVAVRVVPDVIADARGALVAEIDGGLVLPENQCRDDTVVNAQNSIVDRIRERVICVLKSPRGRHPEVARRQELEQIVRRGAGRGGTRRVGESDVVCIVEIPIGTSPVKSDHDAWKARFEAVGVLNPVAVRVDVDTVAERGGAAIAEVLRAVVRRSRIDAGERDRRFVRCGQHAVIGRIGHAHTGECRRHGHLVFAIQRQRVDDPHAIRTREHGDDAVVADGREIAIRPCPCDGNRHADESRFARVLDAVAVGIVVDAIAQGTEQFQVV